LFLSGGRRDHLGAGLAVGGRERYRDAAGGRRLPVLPGDVDIDLPDDADELAGVVLPDPSEHGGDDVGDLPRVGAERPAGPFALSVAEMAEHGEDLVDAVRVEYGAVDLTRLRGLDRRRTGRERYPAVGEVPGDLG
jgi:hypothetical protein